ncbi:MAG: hypothetical protein ACFFEK_02205 [Candidatus Thorarchaeota archaeon]
MKRGSLLVALVFLIVASGSSVSISDNSRPPISESTGYIDDASRLTPIRKNQKSEDYETHGLLDPVVIEQRGNVTNTILHAETDSRTNTKTNLSIDTVNNWIGSRASVELSNLERLYVLNGSLSDGIEGTNTDPDGSVSFFPYGWSAISGSPDPSMEMRAEYYNQQVVALANGYGGGGSYFYANGSYVYWTQTVNNTPYQEDFILNFNYQLGSQSPEGNPDLTLRVYIDETLVWINTTESMLISEWYNSGDILVDLTGIGSQFEFKIGLYISGDFYHSKQKIDFTLDDIHFVGADSPAFDDVSISLNIGPNSTLITGTDVGQASITNSSLWRTEIVSIELIADLAYSFDYVASMMCHRFTNSTTGPPYPVDGVNYALQIDGSPMLEFYRFIGTLPDIDDFTLIVHIPTDWENATVYNPFGTDRTSSCFVQPGNITIPNSILHDLGFWEFHVESPNYIRKLQTLKLDETTLNWIPDNIFRSTNITKASVEIGSVAPIPGAPQNVNFTWILPNGTLWHSEMISGGSSGKINSTLLEFGPSNTSAGNWHLHVLWTNGSEIGFSHESFEVHHSTILTVDRSDIETESSQLITNYIYYKDSENGKFLMSPDATIVANWSVSTVLFSPEPVYNRWIGSFDTSEVGPGTHLVVVNATSPFLDDASCTFNVTINYRNNELTIDNPTAEIGIGDSYLVTFSYEDAFGVGITDANVTIEYSGPADGVTWPGWTELGGGNYSTEFTAVHSGNYAITIAASKKNYDVSSDALFILVGERSTNLELENGTSAIISFGEQYQLVMRYTNGSGFGLDGANVTVESTTPETGINCGTVTNEGNGYYSIILTPAESETFTLLFRFSLADYRTQFVSFTLTATVISTQLRVLGVSSPAVVGVNQPFELLVLYEQTGTISGNISDADIDLTFTSLENLSYTITPLTEGYLISLETNQIGSYEFNIYVQKVGFQSDFETFTLFVRARGMHVVMAPILWIRQSSLEFAAQLREVGTNESIIGANVSYWLLRSGGIVMEGEMSESSPGVYSVSIMPPWSDDIGYSIRIFAEKVNYELDDVYEFQVLQYTPPEILWLIMVRTYGPPLVFIAVVATVSLAGRVVYRRKKAAEFAVDLANQHRFDDVDNIIGVIVMHKISGLPIYSRILKGGFEEGIVAAFIAAVTHFREEFEMFDEEEIRVIPISDIIRAVQTKNLICAFITVKSASIEHNRRMEEFGRQTADFLDSFYTEKTPMSAQDLRISEILDFVFDKTLDGPLLKFHKINKSAKIPKRYRVIKQVLTDMESAHCSKPIYLAKAVSRYGVSESRGCTLVSEAIDKMLIIPCEDHEIKEPDIDLASYLKDFDRTDSS